MTPTTNNKENKISIFKTTDDKTKFYLLDNPTEKQSEKTDTQINRQNDKTTNKQRTNQLKMRGVTLL